MMTDPIADMLTRIRNAQMVKKSEVLVPYSAMKLSIAQILVNERYVAKVERMSGTTARRRGHFVPDQIRIVLRYVEEGKPSILNIQKVSKLGKRVYCSYRDLPRVQNDYGIAILSTSKGVMTNHQARREKVGGEVVCEVW
ncbi:MAG: 30S ribosomal protein S8 [Patescibacteria group bacterium]